MSLLLFFLLVSIKIFSSTYTQRTYDQQNQEDVPATNSGYDCIIRYRRSWYSLTPSEQLLYINGFQSIRKNGALSIISRSYLKATAINKWQDSSLFFMMHEHLVYELENAIRSLGGIYNCFSMPYWDFTIDSGLENNAPILQTSIGGDGDNSMHHCVTSEYWTLCDNAIDDESCYWTPFAMNCNENELESMCCLKRSISSTQILASSIQIAFEIATNPNYEQFTNKIKRFTDYVHAFIASIDNAPMSNMFATEDPIFFLLASFIGYIRAMWTDCNDYDFIPNEELQNYPNAYHAFKTKIKNAQFKFHTDNIDNMYELDMHLNEMFYALNNAEWSDGSISVRSLYDISELNILYEMGSFWTTSKLNTWCEGHVNENWFVDNRALNAYGDILANSNHVNQYIDKVWNELDLQSEDKLAEIAALSCDYVRRTSLNSCFRREMLQSDSGILMCDDMNRKELEDLTLDDLYGFVGDGDDNECFLQIRNETWPYAKHNILLKQSLCNGQFDYKCDIWPLITSHHEYDGYDDLSPILNDGETDSEDDIQHIIPSSHDADFLSFNMSLWSVMVWCAMFIFIFMISCYMFTVKKDFETELMYKKNRKMAHVAIYGSVGCSNAV